MTRIWCQIGDELALEVAGHATGSPAACAGISALVEALGTYIEADQGTHIHKVLAHTVEPGACSLRVEGDEAAAQVWRLVCIGLAQIAMACPEQVRLVGERKNFF